MTSKIKTIFLALLPIFFVVFFSLYNPLFSTAQSDNVCPEGSGWIKYDFSSDSQKEQSHNAGAGNIIDQVCIKGGEIKEFFTADGTKSCWQVIGINTQIATAKETWLGDDKGDDCKDISHVSFHVSPCCLTPSPSATPTNTSTPTSTPTSTNTLTPTPTGHHCPTHSPCPTKTPTPTCPSCPTCTPRPSKTLTPTITNTPTSTPTIESTPTITNTPTNTPTGTLSPSPTPTDTPTPTPTPTPTETPTNTPVPTQTPQDSDDNNDDDNDDDNDDNNVGGDESPAPTSLVAQSIIQSAPTVLGTSDTTNYLIDSIKDAYGGQVLGVNSLPATASDNISGNLPSSNQLIDNHFMSIPSLSILEPVYQSQTLGDELLVGDNQVLLTQINDANVYYGHNQYGLFSNLFQLTKGKSIFINTNSGLQEFTVTLKSNVNFSDLSVFENATAKDIFLVTCSRTYPNTRIVIKASLL